MSSLYFNNDNSTNFIGCPDCGKKYTRKSSLEKHKLLCSILNKTKREKKIEKEEELTSANIPSNVQLYKIIEELTLKCRDMENKLNDMNKLVQRSKKKINVVEWLNNKIKPGFKFDDFKSRIVANIEIVDYAFDNNIIHIMCRLFQQNLKTCDGDCDSNGDGDSTNDSDGILPIYCFVQKVNKFYVYRNVSNSEVCGWCEISKNELIRFFNLIHHRLTSAFREWKIINKEKLNDNDKLYDIYNRGIMKIMNVSFEDDNTFTKMRNVLYNHLKKNLVDYDLE